MAQSSLISRPCGRLLKSLVFWNVLFATFSQSGSTQIMPDDTLGNERSRLTENVTVQQGLGDRVDGGAVRGRNLFHSFQEFNVREGQRLYFANPTGVENILSRVTGIDVSDILGTLGVEGAANLFLLNPNGIIFGRNAALDLRGSFVGTTASAIGFGEQGVFSATTPEAPALLTVNPSTLFFNQLNGSIVSNSIAPADGAFGLRVPDGESLLLVGGDVVVDSNNISAGLSANGGRIELAGLAGAGSIELTAIDDRLSLAVPQNSLLADIVLANDARVSVRGNGGGEIVVNADQLTATAGGRLVAGTRGNETGGSITINANEIRFAGVGMDSGTGSGVFNQAFETAAAGTGNIIIGTRLLDLSEGAAIRNDVFTEATVAPGVIQIQAETVNLNGAGIIQTGASDVAGIRINTEVLTLQAGSMISTDNPHGRGSTSDITIQATNALSLDNSFLGSTSDANSEPIAPTTAGDVWIQTGNLTARNAEIASLNDNLQGNSGNITIRATGDVLLTSDRDANLVTRLYTTADGGSTGNIVLEAANLTLRGASFSTLATEQLAVGNSGNIRISVTGTVLLDGEFLNRSFISTGSNSLVENGQGNAGNIQLTTGSLRLVNSGFMRSSSSGSGRGGQIEITADTVELTSLGATSELESFILSGAFGTGTAGNIILRSDRLTLQDNADISTETNNSGQAGSLDIAVRETVQLSGASSLRSSTLGSGDAGTIQLRASQLQLETASEIIADTYSSGDSGAITINTEQLNLRNGSAILSRTFGSGRGGTIRIDARGAIDLFGTTPSGNDATRISTEANSLATNTAGSILITAGSLSMRNGASILARTSGQQANAGNIGITIRDGITLVGREPQNRFGSAISSNVEPRTVGQGGTIQISARSLTIRDGGVIAADNDGIGAAGNILLNIRDRITLVGTPPGQAFSQTGSFIQTQLGIGSVGRGGNIWINTGSLFASNGSALTANTRGIGDAGDIFINARDQVTLTRSPNSSISRIETIVESDAQGNAGNIRIQTGSLRLEGGSQLFSSTFGEGNSGNITIQATDRVVFRGADTINPGFPSGALTRVGAREFTSDGQVRVTGGVGRGGNIVIRADDLILADGAGLLAETLNQGNAGNIRLHIGGQLQVEGMSMVRGVATPSSIVSEVGEAGIGNGGRIAVSTGSLRLANGGQIRAGTAGQGEAGNVIIQADDRITIAGGNREFSSSILTQTERGATGRAGNIILRANDFQIANRGNVTASTANDRNAGNIRIAANRFRAIEGGQIVTSTSSAGPAGAIRLDVREELFLSGSTESQLSNDRLSNDRNAETVESGLYGNTTPESIGNGGNIFVNAGGVTLQNGAQVSVNSQGTGEGGNIFVQANNLSLLDRAQISAETTSTNGGDVTLNIRNRLLSDRSQITTNAGTQNTLATDRAGVTNPISGGNLDLTAGNVLVLSDRSTISTNSNGNGGNIDISTPAIVAIPTENSNITANAIAGNGGNVQLNATLYGISVANQETASSDITATSERGVQGEIDVTPPNVDPVQGLVELPGNIIDASNQVAAVCPQGRNASEELDRFVVTGRGGLPDNPVENLDTETVLTEWVSPSETISDRTSTPIPAPVSIVEAQNWTIDAAGQVQLVAKEQIGGDRLALARTECLAN